MNSSVLHRLAENVVTRVKYNFVQSTTSWCTRQHLLQLDYRNSTCHGSYSSGVGFYLLSGAHFLKLIIVRGVLFF